MASPTGRQYFNVDCQDRTDGTRWTLRIYAYSEQEARNYALDRIAPHVTIERVYVSEVQRG